MRALGAVIAVLVTSCTFPTVTYEEGCEVPDPPCQIDKYIKDGNDARDTRTSCLDDCGGNPNCREGCESDYAASIANTKQACEACSAQNGCTKAQEACTRWVEPAL